MMGVEGELHHGTCLFLKDSVSTTRGMCKKLSKPNVPRASMDSSMVPLGRATFWMLKLVNLHYIAVHGHGTLISLL